MSEPKNPNSFEVELPVRILPDGTIRVGQDLHEEPKEWFTFPVVPNEPVKACGGDGTSPYCACGIPWGYDCNHSPHFLSNGAELRCGDLACRYAEPKASKTQEKPVSKDPDE